MNRSAVRVYVGSRAVWRDLVSWDLGWTTDHFFTATPTIRRTCNGHIHPSHPPDAPGTRGRLWLPIRSQNHVTMMRGGARLHRASIDHPRSIVASISNSDARPRLAFAFRHSRTQTKVDSFVRPTHAQTKVDSCAQQQPLEERADARADRGPTTGRRPVARPPSPSTHTTHGH